MFDTRLPTGRFFLLGGEILMPIEQNGKTYGPGEKSAPIKRVTDEGYGIRTVIQILLGNHRGGKIITESTFGFNFTLFGQLGSYSRTKQRLRPGKEITLTDGTKAKGV